MVLSWEQRMENGDPRNDFPVPEKHRKMGGKRYLGKDGMKELGVPRKSVVQPE